MCGKDYPSSYLNGYADFYYERYKVTEGVLIPRPDTEILVEAALMACGALGMPMGDVANIKTSVISDKILMADICAGTGCVGISTANALIKAGKECSLTLVDISDTALSCCESNKTICKADVQIRKADILNDDVLFEDKLSLITSNPPYITDDEMDELPLSVTYEPELALRGGKDGLDFYGRLCQIGRENLINGGILAVEHGYLQQEDVIEIFKKNGYSDVTGLKDYGGNPRVVVGTWRGE